MDSRPESGNHARKPPPASTVGRACTAKSSQLPDEAPPRWTSGRVHVWHGDSRELCRDWPAPDVIISDGAYGVLGFEGDTADPDELGSWYEPHIAEWSKKAKPSTTLWFWNSEVGWATVHPVLQKYGWKYVNANIWNKGKSHVAGNVNTQTIRRFPVVTEICV